MSPTPTGRWTKLTRAYLVLLLARATLFPAGSLFLPKSAFKSVLDVMVHWQGFVVSLVLGLVWLHRAWTRVAPPYRQASAGRPIAPDEAVWKLFIPIYGIYWLFIANVGLCRSVENQLRDQRARSVSVPSTLASIACVVQLVPLLNLFVAPFLWGIFMARVDTAQTEAERLDPKTRAIEPLGALRLLGIICGVLIYVWLMGIVVFSAIWQLLNPDLPHAAHPH